MKKTKQKQYIIQKFFFNLISKRIKVVEIIFDNIILSLLKLSQYLLNKG